MVVYREVVSLLRLRPTLRTQLTLLYGGLLAVLGGGLLFLLVPLQGSASVQDGPHAAAVAAALNAAIRNKEIIGAIALPVVVLDDKWLALIKVKQIRRQFPLYGTELQEEDYGTPPAHYFGVPAVGVASAEALEAAVKSALAAAGPTVIEATVDSEHYLETVYD